MTSIQKIPYASLLIKEVCEELHLWVWIEPDYWYVGYIEYPNGKKHLFKNTNFNINPLWSIEICKDKEYCALFLKKFWYQVPEWEVFFGETMNQRIEKKKTIDDGKRYALSIGFPLIIKPNNLSQGVWVMKLLHESEYMEAALYILQKTQTFRIEKFYSGNDYRIVVFDDEIISAYQRIPLQITGDGHHTIWELLRIKQEIFSHNGRDTMIDLTDPRMIKNIKRSQYTFDTILLESQVFQLLDNANLSTWWESIDVTEKIHKDFQNIAIRSTYDMWLRLSWVDIIVWDITKSIEDNHNNYIILEINGAPWLDNYLCSWAKQREYVKNLYKKIILALWL